MAITAAQVKSLREKTGAGMMDCKRALVETNGDEVAAEKLLKEKGLAAVEKRTDRTTSEGLIVIKGDEKKISMAELVCETDFVAKNEDFIKLANEVAEKVYVSEINEVTEDLNSLVLDLATRVRENMSVNRVACIKTKSGEFIDHYVHHDKKTASAVLLSADNPSIFENEDVKNFAHDCCLHIVAYTPEYLSKDDVSEAYIEEQREVFEKQVAEMDKSESVKAGIVQGKINKQLAGICFVEQPFISDEKVSVGKAMVEVAKKAGGTLKVEKMYFWQVGD